MVINFTQVTGMVPENGSLTFVFQKTKDGSLVMSVNAKHKKTNKKGELEDAEGSGDGFTPMVFRGTPAELDEKMKDVSDMLELQKEYLALPEVPAASTVNKKKTDIKNKIQERKDKLAKAETDKAKATGSADTGKTPVAPKQAESGTMSLFSMTPAATAAPVEPASSTPACSVDAGEEADQEVSDGGEEENEEVA